MFDLSKLGDMAKIAGEAKEMQAKQERTAKEQTALLQKISMQLETVIALLKK
jgi:membrane protein required for beta-lactamase induction